MSILNILKNKTPPPKTSYDHVALSLHFVPFGAHNRAYAAHCVALVRPNCSPGGRNFLGCLKIPPLGSQLRISPMLSPMQKHAYYKRPYILDRLSIFVTRTSFSFFEIFLCFFHGLSIIIYENHVNIFYRELR